MFTRRSVVCFGIAVFLSIVVPAFSESEEYTLDKAHEYKDIAVQVIKRIHLPKGYHEGLFFDGQNIWVANGKKGKIWVIDRVSGKIIADIEPIAGFTEGMTTAPDGGYYVTDWDEQKLYLAKNVGKGLIAEREMSLAPAHPAGVVWNGQDLFVITWTRGVGTKFHLLQLDRSGVLLKQIFIRAIQEPAHMAWDGTYLWITSWYSKLVYKVDIKTWEAVGSFTSPVSAATGIAWDGEYFWLTGTHGDLYQLKVGGG